MTGSTGSTASMMPKREANFASGGNSPVATGIGKRAALESARPESSRTFGGSSILYCVDSLKGPRKVTSEIEGLLWSSEEIVGAIREPSGATSATCLASAIAMGWVNHSDRGVTGIHAA